MLQKLKKSTTRSQKRVGRGYGSGKAKTSGRGTKGRKARGKVPLFFEGGALPLIKRMPMLKGMGKNKSFKAKPVEVDLKDLEVFAKGTTVDAQKLADEGIIKDNMMKRGFKVLGNGEITKALKIKGHATQGAVKKIEKAGGELIVEERK